MRAVFSMLLNFLLGNRFQNFAVSLPLQDRIMAYVYCTMDRVVCPMNILARAEAGRRLYSGSVKQSSS